MTIQVIEDPEKVKVVADETRQKMLFMLAKRSMSISELARALSKTPATIFYHIKKLESANLIKLEKTEVVNNNLVEKYYSLSGPSCLIGLRVPAPERGPVPPKKLFEAGPTKTKLCPDICWDDVFTALELKCQGNRKKQLFNIINDIFSKASLEASEAFKEVLQQFNIKLSLRDQQKLQRLAGVIPILIFCKMVEKPENLNALKNLINILHPRI